MIGRVYRHYKGGYYRVERIAQSSEQPGVMVVIYFSLATRTYWARPLLMFTEDVPLGGAGGWEPRFRLVSLMRGWWERIAHWLWKA